MKKIIDTISNDVAIREYYGEFGQYNFEMSKEITSYSVDSILYDGSYTKCIAFINFRKLNTVYTLQPYTSFSCSTIYGFRDSIGTRWHYYPWTVRTYESDDSISALWLSLDFYKSFEFKKTGRMQNIDSINQISVDFKYNIQDSVFWDSCFIWKKNQFANNTYPFQYLGFNTFYNKTRVVPEITVPLSKGDVLSYKNEIIAHQKYGQ